MTAPVALANLFAQFVRERLYLKAVSVKTETWYWTSWKAFEASQIGVGEIILTKAKLQAFVIRLRDKGLKPRSVNSYLQALNAFALWLHQEHGRERVRLPLLRTERKVLRVYEDPSLRLLLSFKPSTFPEWRIFAVTVLLLDTGCRIDEVLGLAEGSLDLDALTVRVLGKGSKERTIPISVECRKVLYRYLGLRKKAKQEGGYVFGTRNKTRLTHRNALRDFYRLKDLVGLPHDGGFHRLRHSFATGYLRHGGEVVRLQKQLGHSRIETTLGYLHLQLEDLKETHRRVSPLSRLR